MGSSMRSGYFIAPPVLNTSTRSLGRMKPLASSWSSAPMQMAVSGQIAKPSSLANRSIQPPMPLSDAATAQPPLSRQESQVSLQLLNAMASCLDGAFSERPAALAACAAYVSCVLSGRDAPTSLLALEKVPAEEAATVAAALAAGAREVLDPRRALRCLRRTEAAELAARRTEEGAGAGMAGASAAAASSDG